MTRTPPARRHLDPAGRWRLAPELVGTGALLVFLLGTGGLLHTWASGWDTARAEVPVPTVERSTFVAREVPPLDVTVTVASDHSEAVVVSTQMPIAPARTYAGAPEQVETQTRATPLSSQRNSTTPLATTNAPLTSTNAPTTTAPSTTAATTTTPVTTTASSPTQTTAPTESEATVSVPIDVTEVVESENE